MTLRLLPMLLLLSACAVEKQEVDENDEGLSDDTDSGQGQDTGPFDADGDGWVAAEDCDDGDAAVNAPTAWHGDGDGDGYGGPLTVEACEAPAGFVLDGTDCDDGDDATFPGAEETCSDEEDRNCDGSVGAEDADADGVVACLDCNDADASSRPGGTEVCDGADNDCDGTVDDDAPDADEWYADVDEDGFGDEAVVLTACEQPAASSTRAGDCDDADAAFYPGAPESCDIAVDYNCDGSTGGDDADGDGVQACDDCDDADITAFPGAAETCDGDDEDCDGEVDEAGAGGESTFYADADGDGYGDVATTATSCEAAEGYVADASDCDDADVSINPAAEEVCDGAVDEDCDGSVDDADPTLDTSSASTWYLDFDDDGFGGARYSVAACAAPSGYVADSTDCDDTRASVSPAGTEVCDAADLDEDCDGAADDDDTGASGASTWYADADGDGYGVGGTTVSACDVPSSYVDNDDDCDDTDVAVNPGAAEVCDPDDVDEDCNGLADDADTAGDASFYYDGDGDGFGDASIAVTGCDASTLWVANDEDCDDDDNGDYPLATEVVGNADDEDCDGGELCWLDADDDGYLPASPGTVVSADADCSDASEALTTSAAGDCDDASAAASPAGVESCNLVDDDCDGTVDDGVGSIFYADTDTDGYGDASSTTLACSVPTGYAANDDDCDDSTNLASPAGIEVCADGYDNDCDDSPTDCGWAGANAATTADYRFTGVVSSDQLGRSAATGDFNGDGNDDLAGGIGGYDSPASGTGGAAVWYGPMTASESYNGADLLFGGSTSTSAYHGYAMAAADHNGDGMDELVVGAYYAGSYYGLGYIVYGRASRGSSSLALAGSTATMTGAVTYDYFGWAVGGGDDLDGDGYEEIVMGAYGTDTPSSSAGAAYLYYGSSTTRSSASASAADFTVRGISASSYLGYSVATVPDVDGDGFGEMLVGAYYDSTSASYAGSAYLFLGDSTRRSGVVSASTADYRWGGLTSSDYFGYDVAGLGDINGDGYGEVGVNAYYADGAVTSAGALYIYNGGGALPTTASATLYGTTAYDYFGKAAYSPGDQDGDGVNDIAVGAWGQDTGYTSSGAVYFWYGPVSGSLSASTADASFHGPSSGGDSYLGWTMPDRATDLTGDGVPDLVAGGYYDDSAVYDGGALYVWEGLGGE